MVSSPGFGSNPHYLYAHFRLAFATAPTLPVLTLQHKLTRRLILQKACCCTHMVLQHLVNLRFQVLFHSPFGVLFTFPSRYSYTIGHQRVFSLTGWSPRIPTQFHVLDCTQVANERSMLFAYRTITFSGRPFQAHSAKHKLCNSPEPFRRFLLAPITPPLQRPEAVT